MSDAPIDFEISDNDGSTTAFSGTATTAPTNIPSSPGNRISGFIFNISGNAVEISADGGSTYFQLPKDAVGSKDIKGDITQLKIRTSSGSASYSLWVDFEEN